MAASDATTHLAGIFAANLRAARRAADMTQHELAVTLGRGDAMTVSRWERGEHKPNDKTLIELARLFDRPVAWFYTDHSGA